MIDLPAWAASVDGNGARAGGDRLGGACGYAAPGRR